MIFSDTIGNEYLFYGCDNHRFKIDEMVFEAIEDPDDGWRSCLGSIEVVKGGTDVFYREPLAIIKVVESSDSYQDTYKLVEDDGHVWLEFGTDRQDDYYPSFVFSYTPKPKPPAVKKLPKSAKITEQDPFDYLFNPREV